MNSIELTYEAREGKDIFANFDMADYALKTFGMFGGTEETVSIEIPKKLVGVFIDRFGESAAIRQHLTTINACVVRVSVNTSPQFYAWLFGLGKDVRITSPQSVRNDFIEYTKQILSNYDS